MYAIISDSGTQYKVEEGQLLSIDYRDSATGDEVRFERVLGLSNDDGFQVGTPVLDGVVVTAEVTGVQQGPKLTVQKFRKRKNSRRKTGHRQLYTQVRIKSIG